MLGRRLHNTHKNLPFCLQNMFSSNSTALVPTVGWDRSLVQNSFIAQVQNCQIHKTTFSLPSSGVYTV